MPGWAVYKQVFRFLTNLVSKGKEDCDFAKEELQTRVLLLSDEQYIPSSAGAL